MHSRDLEGLYRRYQRNERLARQHWAALAGRCGAERGLGAAAGPAPFDTTASTHLPPSIPRGKPTAWYAERAQYYAAKAADAHDVYWALYDAAKKQAWAALSRDDQVAELRRIGARISALEGTLREYRAKIPAWDRELAEHGPPVTGEDQVWAWRHAQANPHAMVQTMTDAVQAAQAEREWLLGQLADRPGEHR